MVVEVHPARALPAPVGAEIAARLARCFETDFGGRSFFTQPYHLRRVKRRYGKLVGHMALLLRSVLLGDRRMSIAALAEVATDPDHRSQGIAAGLL